MDKMSINNTVTLTVTASKPNPLLIFAKGEKRLEVHTLPAKIPAGYRLIYDFRQEVGK